MRYNVFSLTGYAKEEENEVWLTDELPEIDMEIAYRVEALLHYEQSPFQEISVAETTGFGRMLVLDGKPQFTAKYGFLYNEMMAHVPIMTHAEPRTVAIVGGGTCQAAKEAAKHKEVRQIDVVEIDSRVVDVSRAWLSPAAADEQDRRVRMIYRDGAEWIKEQKGCYDVLIVDRFYPSGPAMLLYKPAFYADAFDSLSEAGVAVFQSGAPFGQLRILKDTLKHLRKLFPIVRTYFAPIPTLPGGVCSFTIASKERDPLQADINRLPGHRTKYMDPETFRSSFVVPGYLKESMK